MLNGNKVGILDVVDLLQLERNPKNPNGNGTNFWVKCPLCNSSGYKMNINIPKNSYRCVICCPVGEKGLGFLDLYARVRLGTRHYRGPNGNRKELMAHLLDDLHIPPDDYRQYVRTAKPTPMPKIVKRAPDDRVSAAYTALLNLKPLKALSKNHLQNLTDRGLSKDDILQNGYRTFSIERLRPYISQASDWLDEKEVTTAKATLGPLKHTRFDYIKAGLVIASMLQKKNIRMDGVPGFYKLGKQWCFRFNEGIAIPTRNEKGEIVSIQMRLDSGNLRYLTVSSSGLPEGVNEKISRVHFPLRNAKIDSSTKVFITEGPLKADVALALGGYGNVAFIAIQGVSNTADLPEIFKNLKSQGVSVIHNALDMDKLTNPHVAHGSVHIRKLATSAGLRVEGSFWDVSTAISTERQFSQMCSNHNIEIPKTNNLYVRLGRMTELLYQANVEVSHQWPGELKGIDDFLLDLKHKATPQPLAQ